MIFDDILQADGICYGFVKGNRRIVFIKCGLGGSCAGYENKYLKMARHLKEKYGCSVIVASNPNDNKDHMDTDRQTVEKYISDNGIPFPELFFFGHSNGCTKGLALAASGVRFERMVLVNMPLTINLHKTGQYISQIPDTAIVAVYGDSDPSYPYIPFIRGKYENVKVISVPKADHNFQGLMSEFIHLGDKLMCDGSCK